jgi:hypothetical protein
MPFTVSLVRLIATPAVFDGQQVRVCGYLDFNGLDRSVGLYLSEIDARNSILSNSISVQIDEPKVRPLLRHYVVLSGVFRAPDPRFGFNGSLDKISGVMPWPPAAK